MVKENHKSYTIWKLEWPEILEGEETYGLARELATNLREVDRREILAFTDDVEQEVQESIDWSYELQYATTKDGRIIAIWGVQPKRNDEGARTHSLIWCLGTDLIKRYTVSFAKESRAILQEWAKRYGSLYNMVGTFNDDAIRWLQWVGASFDASAKIIKNGETFLPFVIHPEPEKEKGGD